MKWFNDMRLGPKLLLGFGVTLAIVLMQGVFAISRVNLIGKQAQNITDDALPSVAALSDMNTRASDVRISSLRYVATTSPEEAQRYLEEGARHSRTTIRSGTLTCACRSRP